MQTVAVLLAGGSGRRLYPASRPDRPKQFLSFGGDQSLIERTAARVSFADHVFVVTPDRYVDAVTAAVPDAEVVVEPASRDTGPALVYAAHRIRDRVGECVLCCLPTDHYVGESLEPVLIQAVEVAQAEDSLVTVGIEPDRPATGYGYIEPGDLVDDAGVRRVRTFHEKPAVETAETYLDRGWLWNSGMFVWRAGRLLEATRSTVLGELVSAFETGSGAATYRGLDSVSVDHAILEHTDDLVVVPADLEWADVGSWDAVGRVFGEDLAAASHRVASPGTVLASDDVHITAVGVEDLVVAAYGDRVVVCPRKDAERLREVADDVLE